MDRKMRSIEWVEIIFSIIGFAASVYSSLYMDKLFALACYSVTALLLLLFAISARREDEDRDAIESCVNIGELAAKNDELSSKNEELTVKNGELTLKNNELVSENEELVSKNEGLSKEVDLLKMLATEASAEQPEKIRNVLFDDAMLSESEEVDLAKVVDEVLSQMKPFADPKGIRMSVSCASSPVMIKANYKLMSIMLRNIIDNSIKYMRRAGNLHVTLSKVDNDIFIICKDDGFGLASDELVHIFELNYQGSNRVSGNGLGLTQARDIVKAYNGEIYAKSNNGSGMGIYIQLQSAEDGQ